MDRKGSAGAVYFLRITEEIGKEIKLQSPGVFEHHTTFFDFPLKIEE
jgi:hypothetical protein